MVTRSACTPRAFRRCYQFPGPAPWQRVMLIAAAAGPGNGEEIGVDVQKDLLRERRQMAQGADPYRLVQEGEGNLRCFDRQGRRGAGELSRKLLKPAQERFPGLRAFPGLIGNHPEDLPDHSLLKGQRNEIADVEGTERPGPTTGHRGRRCEPGPCLESPRRARPRKPHHGFPLPRWGPGSLTRPRISPQIYGFVPTYMPSDLTRKSASRGNCLAKRAKVLVHIQVIV